MATKSKALTVQATRKLRDSTVVLCEEEGLDLKAGIEVLNQLYQEREEIISLCSEVEVFWTEGLAACARVMEREFGYNTVQKQINPFTGEAVPTSYLNIDTGPGESVKVTNGTFTIPGTTIMVKPAFEGAFEFMLHAKLRRKDEGKFLSFVESVRAEVQNASIYRGKMLEVQFEWDGDEDQLQPPKFVKPPTLLPSDLILPKVTASYVQTELFSFAKFLEVNRRHKLPMNRKVLLAGPYGTGKSLTAAVLANITHGQWTYLWFKPTSTDTHNPYACLRKVLEVAMHYQPAIVFMEDIDELLGRQRDSLVNEVINTLDGVVGKDAEVLFVATTNNPEALDPVTLRRFDLLVSFELPDAEAAEKLVRLYAGKLLPAKADLSQVGKVLAGKAPSIIASAVESAKRATIYRAEATDSKPEMLPEDVLLSAQARAQHVALIDRPPRVDRDPVEQIADSIVKAADLVVSGKANGHLIPATSVRN